MVTKFYRVMAFVVLICFIGVSTLSPSFAEEPHPDKVKYSNKFIEYMVDGNDGRFIIWTKEGSPIRETDQNKKLLFDKDSDPETSFSTFKIDGKEYIYGNDYGFLGFNSQFLRYPMNMGNKNISTWKVDGLTITQILEIIDDVEHPNVGNVRIRYEVKNNDTKTKKLGTRILLDTMLGDKDGTPFIIGGNEESITKETKLMGEEIPTYWRSTDNIFAPSVISYGFTKGWGNTAPDKMVLGHWAKLSQSKYDIEIDENLDFTSKVNEYGYADSSVALYWDETAINKGETKVFETYYGLGDFSNVDSNSPYGVNINGPSKLTVNDKRDGYNEEEFELGITIDNSLADSDDITNMTAKIIYNDLSFQLTNDYPEKTKPVIEKGESSTFTWKLKPLVQNQYVSEPIRIEITSDNYQQTQRYYTYLLMPSIKGDPPNVQIQSVSPKKIYYQGARSFSIKGQGFDAYKNTSLWNMYIVDELGNQYKIPDKCINVADDTKIAVNIDEGDIAENTPQGKYYVKLVHSDEQFGTITNTQLTMEMTNDETYKARNYGVMFVEKRKKDDNYYYYINSVDTKKELDLLKEDIKKGNIPPKYRDPNKGELVDIVLDIIGDVKKYTIEGEEVYKVFTENQDVIINSAVIYKKGSSNPLEIKKNKSAGMIMIQGNGTLQMPNYGEFWWFPFYTYLADETNYVVNKVVEEEEEDKDEEEEEEENIVISIFDPMSVVSAGVGMVFDGFDAEIRDVVLLDEGASFGGMLNLEIPVKAKSKQGGQDTEDNKLEDISETETLSALVDILFDIAKERKAKNNAASTKTVTQKKDTMTIQQKKEKDRKKRRNAKILALLLNDVALGEEIMGLFKDENPTSEKAETIVKLIATNITVTLTIGKIIKESKNDGTNGGAEDGDEGSVGFTIDVQKILFGKKYSIQDKQYMYDDFRYIGLDAEGEISLELPVSGFTNASRGGGVAVAVDTIENVYSLKADVNTLAVEAHAYITLMKFNNKLYLDDLVVSGGYRPGVPIVPPIFVNEIGGGVENLAESFINTYNPPPIKVILKIGLSLEPSFFGDFTLGVTHYGFDLDGEFLFYKIKIFQKAHIGVRWAHPMYLEASALLNAFDIIVGQASFYIGEKATDDPKNPYKFYMEGKAKAGVYAPKGIPVVGGMQFAGIDLGLSTEKVWGSLKVLLVKVGIAWVYDEGIKFADKDGTNMTVPYYGWYSEDFTKGIEKGRLLVGTNIKVIGSSSYAVASSEGLILPSTIVASLDRKLHQVEILPGQEAALIQISFRDDVPNLTVKDPQGNAYGLINYENDPEHGNYLVQIIPAGESQSGQEEKAIYMTINNPAAGTWTIESDTEIETQLMDVATPPGLNGLDFEESAENQIHITWDAHHTDNSLVTLFLVNEETPDTAGYNIAKNLDGSTGSQGITLDIPKGLPEGKYIVRATISHPDYGYESMDTEKTIEIQDPYKPARVEGLNVELYGNGLLDMAWNPVTSEDGDMSYYVTVYDENDNPVPGFMNFETTENSIVLGGEYKVKDPLSADQEVTVKLQTDNVYQVGVIAKKTRKDGDVETFHISDETRSENIFLRSPTPPEINLNLQGDWVTFNGSQLRNAGDDEVTRYGKDSSITLDFTSDQNEVTTEIYVDGEFFIDFEGSSYTLPLDLEDGEHIIKFITSNKYGDVTEKTIRFNIDTAAPELMLDSPVQGQVSNDGKIIIKGTAEPGARITVNGRGIPLDETGIFEYEYSLVNGSLMETIEVKAADLAGNSTVFSTEVTNDTVKPFEKVYIEPVINRMLSGTTQQFDLYAMDGDGEKIKLTPEDVQWYIMEGEAIADVTEDGEVAAHEGGEIVLRASYYISDDYSFDDAIEIKIDSNIEYVYITPDINAMAIGDEVNLVLYEKTRYDENPVDNKLVKWEILEGNDFGEIDLYGHLTANGLGVLKVKGSYTDRFGNTQEAIKEITINTYQSSNKNKDINKNLSKIWLYLVQQEKNLEIQSVNRIDPWWDRKISVRNNVEILLPAGTVSNSDELFVGTVNNPMDYFQSQEYLLHGDIIELQLKEAEGKLNKSIEVTFKFKPTEDMNPSDLGVYYYNPKFEKWQYIGGQVDVKNGTVKVNLPHLSKYAILEKQQKGNFADISGRWSEKYIQTIDSIGLTSGEIIQGERYYSPHRELTRLEFAAMVIRAYEKMYKGEITDVNPWTNSFADYETTPDWGKEYVKKAYEYGLVKGIEMGDKSYFLPQNKITRAEIITILGRILKKNTTENPAENTFIDKADIPNWASEYVDLLYDTGLLTGYGDHSIKPNKNITREEIAKICYDWIDYRDLELKKK